MILISHPSDPRGYLVFENIFEFIFVIKLHFFNLIGSHSVSEIEDRYVLYKQSVIILGLMLGVNSIINVVLYLSVNDEKYD